MARQGLGNECVMMDARGEEALSGAVGASTTRLARLLGQYLLWRWISGRWRRRPMSASDRFASQTQYVAWLEHPALDVRNLCDVCLVLGSDYRHPFIKWI